MDEVKPLPALPEIANDGIRSTEYRCIQCKECGENNGEWVRIDRYRVRKYSDQDPVPWDIQHKRDTGHRRYWHHAYVRNHGEVW